MTSLTLVDTHGSTIEVLLSVVLLDVDHCVADILVSTIGDESPKLYTFFLVYGLFQPFKYYIKTYCSYTNT